MHFAMPLACVVLLVNVLTIICTVCSYADSCTCDFVPGSIGYLPSMQEVGGGSTMWEVLIIYQSDHQSFISLQQIYNNIRQAKTIQLLIKKKLNQWWDKAQAYTPHLQSKNARERLTRSIKLQLCVCQCGNAAGKHVYLFTSYGNNIDMIMYAM